MVSLKVGLAIGVVELIPIKVATIVAVIAVVVKVDQSSEYQFAQCNGLTECNLEQL